MIPETLSLLSLVISIISSLLFIIFLKQRKLIKIILILLYIFTSVSALWFYSIRILKQSIDGDYEWQWAGENWIGKVRINNNMVYMNVKRILKTFYCRGDTLIIQYKHYPNPIIKTYEPGSIKPHIDGQGFDMTIVVRKNVCICTNSICHYKPGIHIITANLRKVDAFGGVAKDVYISDEGDTIVSYGDIILVKYRSGDRF